MCVLFFYWTEQHLENSHPQRHRESRQSLTCNLFRFIFGKGSVWLLDRCFHLESGHIITCNIISRSTNTATTRVPHYACAERPLFVWRSSYIDPGFLSAAKTLNGSVFVVVFVVAVQWVHSIIPIINFHYDHFNPLVTHLTFDVVDTLLYLCDT